MGNAYQIVKSEESHVLIKEYHFSKGIGSDIRSVTTCDLTKLDITKLSDEQVFNALVSRGTRKLLEESPQDVISMMNGQIDHRLGALGKQELASLVDCYFIAKMVKNEMAVKGRDDVEIFPTEGFRAVSEGYAFDRVIKTIEGKLPQASPTEKRKVKKSRKADTPVLERRGSSSSTPKMEKRRKDSHFESEIREHLDSIQNANEKIAETGDLEVHRRGRETKNAHFDSVNGILERCVKEGDWQLVQQTVRALFKLGFEPNYITGFRELNQSEVISQKVNLLLDNALLNHGSAQIEANENIQFEARYRAFRKLVAKDLILGDLSEVEMVDKYREAAQKMLYPHMKEHSDLDVRVTTVDRDIATRVSTALLEDVMGKGNFLEVMKHNPALLRSVKENVERISRRAVELRQEASISIEAKSITLAAFEEGNKESVSGLVDQLKEQFRGEVARSVDRVLTPKLEAVNAAGGMAEQEEYRARNNARKVIRDIELESMGVQPGNGEKAR